MLKAVFSQRLLITNLVESDTKFHMFVLGDGTYIATASSIDYTGETLAVCVTTAIVSSLVLGFMGGYIFGCRGKAEHLMALATDPEDYTRRVLRDVYLFNMSCRH